MNNSITNKKFTRDNQQQIRGGRTNQGPGRQGDGKEQAFSNLCMNE